MWFREGDFIQSAEGLIFDVKGLIHPPDKAIAFLRYIPDPNGNRTRNEGEKYRKIYDLQERYELLRRSYPNYIGYDQVLDEVVNIVPIEKIAIHYQPIQKTHELTRQSQLEEVERQTSEFINLISTSTPISLGKIGVSGSVLVGLFSKNSDIDIIIYGSENCNKAREALTMLLKEDKILRRYTHHEVEGYYRDRQRDTGVTFEDYLFHELRKSFQGYFKGREFFIRYLKDWNEINESYGDTRYKAEGYAKIKGIITKDSEAIFTPCTYRIDNEKIIEGKHVSRIEEVTSFRGRFCEQARTGEEVIAQGKLEQVDHRGNIYYRLLLGNTSRDFMITTNRK